MHLETIFFLMSLAQLLEQPTLMELPTMALQHVTRATTDSESTALAEYAQYFMILGLQRKLWVLEFPHVMGIQMRSITRRFFFYPTI